MKKLFCYSLIFLTMNLWAQDFIYQKGIHSETVVAGILPDSKLVSSDDINLDEGSWSYKISENCSLNYSSLSHYSKISKKSVLYIKEIEVNYTKLNPDRYLKVAYAMTIAELALSPWYVQERVAFEMREQDQQLKNKAILTGNYKITLESKKKNKITLDCTGVYAGKDLAKALGNDFVFYEKIKNPNRVREEI